MSGNVTHPAAQPVRRSSGVAATSLGASHVATAHPADCHRSAVAATISADPAHMPAALISCPKQHAMMLALLHDSSPRSAVPATGTFMKHRTVSHVVRSYSSSLTVRIAGLNTLVRALPSASARTLQEGLVQAFLLRGRAA